MVRQSFTGSRIRTFYLLVVLMTGFDSVIFAQEVQIWTDGYVYNQIGKSLELKSNFGLKKLEEKRKTIFLSETGASIFGIYGKRYRRFQDANTSASWNKVSDQ
jgi:uncharacterized protein Veg